MKIRERLLAALGGIDAMRAAEFEAQAEAKAHSYYEGKLNFYTNYTKKIMEENKALRAVIQNISYRDGGRYYNWACEYCSVEDCRRLGWCRHFEPKR